VSHVVFGACAFPAQAQGSEPLQDECEDPVAFQGHAGVCVTIRCDLQKLEAIMSSCEKDLHALRSEVLGRASAGSGSGAKHSKVGSKPRKINLKGDMAMTSLHKVLPPGSALFKDTYNNGHQLHFTGPIASRSWPLCGCVGAIVKLLKAAWAAAGMAGGECPHTGFLGEGWRAAVGCLVIQIALCA
jgi:hypothetical protein